MLPTKKTDINGKYRFENLSSWGAYTVHADDEKAGYSEYSTGLVRDIPTGPGVYSRIAQIILSPQQPEGEFNFRLPPKAGFLHIHLTSRSTGAPIAVLDIKVTSQDEPYRFNFSEGSFVGSRYSPAARQGFESSHRFRWISRVGRKCRCWKTHPHGVGERSGTGCATSACQVT